MFQQKINRHIVYYHKYTNDLNNILCLKTAIAADVLYRYNIQFFRVKKGAQR